MNPLIFFAPAFLFTALYFLIFRETFWLLEKLLAVLYVLGSALMFSTGWLAKSSNLPPYALCGLALFGLANVLLSWLAYREARLADRTYSYR